METRQHPGTEIILSKLPFYEVECGHRQPRCRDCHENKHSKDLGREYTQLIADVDDHNLHQPACIKEHAERQGIARVKTRHPAGECYRSELEHYSDEQHSGEGKPVRPGIQQRDVRAKTCNYEEYR